MDTGKRLREIRDIVLPASKETIEEGSELLLAYVLAPDGKFGAIVAPEVNNNEEYFLMVNGVLNKLGALGAVVFMDSFKGPGGGVRPCLHPERKEVLMVLLLAQGFSEGWVYPYSRSGEEVKWGEPSRTSVKQNKITYFRGEVI